MGSSDDETPEVTETVLNVESRRSNQTSTDKGVVKTPKYQYPLSPPNTPRPKRQSEVSPINQEARDEDVELPGLVFCMSCSFVMVGYRLEDDKNSHGVMGSIISACIECKSTHILSLPASTT